ncbi:hypothetical protein BGW36DRAFT_374731 [Talaromyces proteolyticus]|uniref:HD domain-containing protein n=1 Tax=Talaromyces proteolyticus TaxID=1131652 RepID=A0AAD4Q0D2_9EURO|nr:uncharacterized protein BGW36DRAFT_374731 [Talaromyces proteolyticus]KAH8700669.1 hypothetical protein BGW36DRAFT_374731 [Talaromyces proteolyticus]
MSQPLLEAMTGYMTQSMSGHDPSHNPAHVHRVVRLAHQVLEGELSRHPDTAINYDRTIITLAATLHDIGDHKYLPETSTNQSNDTNKKETSDPTRMVYNILKSHGADTALAERVQTIVSHVSYSHEIRNPQKVRDLLVDERYRELAVVQDADRLDAIGAVGIARTFTYLGSQGEKRRQEGRVEGWELEESIEHFGEKLEKLESMMKTDTGRAMAAERTKRLREFKKWWVDETAVIA